ncbi:MAG: acetyl-CoA carboxylase biotin carboxyl carrier protein [Eubacterium sp.]
MKETDIRKYAVLMKELGLTGLEITEENNMVRLERNIMSAPKESAVIDVSDALAESKSQGNSDYVSVKSPIVGVFYSSPAENAEPYVSIGDYVEKGATLCIIEAMKLMNEIYAEESGIISEICVANGNVVEYGTELFKIKR